MTHEIIQRTSLPAFLAHLGYHPAQDKRNKSDSLWYLSPFREEHTPSFHVKPSTGEWYDFGTDQGGDLGTLVGRMFNLTNFRDVLNKLEELLGTEPASLKTRPVSFASIPTVNPMTDIMSVGGASRSDVLLLEEGQILTDGPALDSIGAPADLADRGPWVGKEYEGVTVGMLSKALETNVLNTGYNPNAEIGLKPEMILPNPPRKAFKHNLMQ